ncbi:N-acetyltransferase 10 [Mycoemilia scoparia]|uniref:RNA cytidine acetyltransferase n=1 Tax=Mycoemilia scoparia TaxID=417184 RepID=A0A9W7ZQV6_9FUNG|nr:N-acetyltransferase 10 [Mycoemilia scoparia]
MVKKVVDSRINTLIKNGVQDNRRSFFVIVGDKGNDQIVNLHWMLSQARVSGRPSVLWCYKKDLGFTSHRKKREAKIKREIKKGIRDVNADDPFELFVSSTNIRYTYYKETPKVLGNTFGMCVLQDFEAITPNVLAQTIETVEGGGVVVLLLKTMKSLKQLYTMSMDVHSRYRTEAHHDVVGRFNERFMLSLAECKDCLVVDDELNVLPVSAGRSVKPLPAKKSSETKQRQVELKELQTSLNDTDVVGPLVGKAKTLDQAKAVMTFLDTISEKTLRSTVSLTAARGRGKSAALGIALAGAVAYGYSNIFITSPSPENLKTLFEFILKGFDALGYEEHLDYDILQSTNPAFNNSIVRININRQQHHRQTIQYIQPQDSQVLAQAELVVIDEAAAIPLPLVKKLIGPYLVFMASTINGYEGTGRSLSLKLLQQLREQSRGGSGVSGLAAVSRGGDDTTQTSSTSVTTGGRSLKEITLQEPIRYSPGDRIEKWLNKLLCLDATVASSSKVHQGCPHPSDCQLYWLNRDALFSYHPASEAFLQRIMALYVSSHYKNSPNDLQLMSDAPAHQLFVLLPPIDHQNSNTLPEPLCVVQVCLEGEISRKSIMSALSQGRRSGGDMIPWIVSQQYQDPDFASLSGARVVRIATHPDYTSMGYGARSLELLEQFYKGEFHSISENDDDDDDGVKAQLDDEQGLSRLNDDQLESVGGGLHKETIAIRQANELPPLFLRLSEKKVTRLHWLGVSYGLTPQLHKFWKRSKFVPIYLRQTTNDLTGEHTCVMLKELPSDGLALKTSSNWLDAFAKDFQRRFMTLLSFSFEDFTPILAMSIIESIRNGRTAESIDNDRKNLLLGRAKELYSLMSPFDLKRLDSYSNNLVDYHVIIDLVPTIADLVFRDRLHGAVDLSGVQSCLLLGIGLQRKSIENVAKDLNLPDSQILALFIKIIRKASKYFGQVEADAHSKKSLSKADDNNESDEESDGNDEDSEKQPKRKLITTESTSLDAVSRDLNDELAWEPLAQSLNGDLDEAGKAAVAELKKKQRELIDSMDLEQYAIGGTDEDWKKAQSQLHDAVVATGGSQKAKNASKTISIVNPDSSKKRKKVKSGVVSEIVAQEEKRKGGGSSNKKVKMSKKTRRS